MPGQWCMYLKDSEGKVYRLQKKNQTFDGPEAAVLAESQKRADEWSRLHSQRISEIIVEKLAARPAVIVSKQPLAATG